MKILNLTLFLFLFGLVVSEAQDSLNVEKNRFKKIRKNLELGSFISTSGEVPYLLRRNQNGVVPFESQFVSLRATVSRDYQQSGRLSGVRLVDYGYGLNMVGNLGISKSYFHLPELYVKLKYSHFEFYGGRRKEIMGLADSTMTSGSFIWSANALPVPRVQISVPDYVPVLWDGLISLKGSYSHGWFGNEGSVRNFYLHQKSFYGRLGRTGRAFKLYGGLNHQVQWGGYNTTTQEKYPSDAEAYKNVVLSLKADSVQVSPGVKVAGNRVGNQLGSIDVAFEIETKYFRLFVYKQTPYEQGSAIVRLANIQDGLNGITLTNKKEGDGIILKKINFEFFYTLNQGRSPLLFGKTIAWELEDYFTNWEYATGWSYRGKTLGTPLITPTNETRTGFYEDGQLINNNRIKAFQLGLNMQLSRKHLLLVQGLHTYNNGRFRNYTIQQLNSRQFSMLMKSEYLLNEKLTLTSSLSFDSGKLYNKNTGLALLLNYNFK